MSERPVTLLVARSDQIRDSLLVLLRSIPQIETIHQVEDTPAALALAPEVQPGLVVLDCDLPAEQAREALDLLQAAWPRARTVVLIDDEDHRARAQACGADLALLKGLRAATVLERIEGLLAEES